MLKGVSRQILEIAQTENPYFERAFLVVRPVCQEFSAAHLDKAAVKFLEQQSPHSGLKYARQKQCLYRLSYLLLGGALGAAFAFIVGMIF